MQADSTEDGARGKAAIGGVNDLRADDENRRSSSAQDRLSDRADQQLADGTRRVRAHDDAVDLALARERENFVGGQAGPHDDFTFETRLADAKGERLEMVLFRARGGGIVVIANARGLRRGYDERVIGMKEDEIGTEFPGLGKRELKGLFVRRYFGGEQDGGGFRPTWLQ